MQTVVQVAVAGVSCLVNSFALLLAPALALADALLPFVLMPALVGDLSLALWLILRDLRTG